MKKRERFLVALLVLVVIMAGIMAYINNKKLDMIESKANELHMRMEAVQRDYKKLSIEMLNMMEEQRELEKRLRKYDRLSFLIHDQLMEHNDLDNDELG